MLRFLVLSAAMLVGSVQNGFAQQQIKSVTASADAMKLYEKSEWTLQIRTNFKNPYLQEDVAVDMELISPSGKQLVLPCYFESGKSGDVSTWKARFMPQETGNYTYRFSLTENFELKEKTSSQSVKATASNKKGILHAADKWTFRFDNGQPFRGLGENICWESRANDDSKYFKALHEKPIYDYERMLPALASYGANYFRTWICSWNLPLDWKSGINNHRYTDSDEYFHPQAIQKMDRMVNLSDSLGLYIMLTLGPGTYDEKHGRYETSTTNFFIDPKARAQYKNRLRFLVARWGYSSAIGAWEFFNEIDNIQFRNKENPIPSEYIVQWHDEMSSYLKQIDPFDHLVTTSISHRDLPGLNSITAIDFNQKHIYKNNRALPTTVVSYSQKFDKPYVIGEFGYEYDWQKNFNDFAEGMDSDFKRGLWYGLFSPTPVLPMSWWWEFFDDRRTDRYFANVRPILDDMMKAGNGEFKPITITASEGAESFAVQCGKKTYLYVYNPGTQSIKTNVKLQLSKKGKLTGKVYDCETAAYATYKTATNTGEGIQLNDVELTPGTDKVFILD